LKLVNVTNTNLPDNVCNILVIVWMLDGGLPINIMNKTPYTTVLIVAWLLVFTIMDLLDYPTMMVLMLMIMVMLHIESITIFISLSVMSSENVIIISKENGVP